MLTIPAIDVDAADSSRHAFALHALNHGIDGGWGEVGEFAVVDRDVGFAARVVARQHRAGHLAHDALAHLLHARVVSGARGSVLLVAFATVANRIRLILIAPRIILSIRNVSC